MKKKIPKYYKKFKVGNKEFETIKEASKFFGINYSTLKANIIKGKKPSEAIKIPKYSTGSIKLKYEGEVFDSLKDFSEKKEIPYHIVQARRIKGWSLSKIVKTEIGQIPSGSKTRKKKENILIIKNKLEVFKKKNKINKFKDFYRISLSKYIKFLGRSTLDLLKWDTIKALQYFYPNEEIFPWKFPRPPKGYWDKKNNRIKYIKWLSKKLKIKNPPDWYKVSFAEVLNKNHGRALLGEGRSVISILLEAYPKYKWKFWLFVRGASGIWQDRNKHKEYLKWLFKKESVNPYNETIYKITSETLRKNHGISLTREYDGYEDCIIKNFPKAKIDKFKFNPHGVRFWINKKNRRDGLLYVGKKLAFKKINDWYGITFLDIQNIINFRYAHYYKNLSEYVMSCLTEYKFDKTKFNFNSKYEYRTVCYSKCLFGYDDIIPQGKEDYLRYDSSNIRMALDVYIPKKKLAIEYNGQQHYFPSAWKNKKEFKKSKLRDKEKKQKCKEHNINLIVIKYNQWDLLPKSFLEIIKKHIKINLDQEKKFWKKLYKEDIYKDILKEIKRSRGSLQTY